MATVSSRSAARELFERLQRDDAWTIVEAWKADREQETHHLEFKCKTDTNTAIVDGDDKDAVAKALSGFANVGGGVLVLGVDAGGGNTKGQAFDRVRRIDPISDVEVFAAPLERTLRGFTDPPIAGLELAVARATNDPTRGIVAILVPPSDGGPHRAVAASGNVNDRYYMRTAAGQQTVPHALLTAMFARTAPPRLELQARLVKASDAGFGVELRLVNAGRGTARRPAVRIAVKGVTWREFPRVVDKYARVDDELADGRRVSTFEPTDASGFVLYPGAETKIWDGHVNEDGRGQHGDVHIVFDATLFALDAQPVHGVATLATEQYEHHDASFRRRAVIAGDRE